MWIEIPVLFEKDDQPNYADLGVKNVDSETEEEIVMMNVNYIESINSCTNNHHTTIHAVTGSYKVNMSYAKVRNLILKAHGHG